MKERRVSRTMGRQTLRDCSQTSSSADCAVVGASVLGASGLDCLPMFVQWDLKWCCGCERWRGCLTKANKADGRAEWAGWRDRGREKQGLLHVMVACPASKRKSCEVFR